MTFKHVKASFLKLLRFPPARAGILGLLLLTSVTAAFADGARIKDLAMIAGARDNQLAGYGLVVGLAGDGDKNPTYTVQTIANLLQRYGITVPASTLLSKNVAVVMVTADIPAFK
jgi:flagellar P-ring protein precursor FlgI